ncbi:MAG: tetratricopeptide repeat protein [Gemmatimonadetes bacterium]|nr:tetratricopeptide repeat protein [Gemmatimonadota bacterium]
MKISALICVLGLWNATAATADQQAQDFGELSRAVEQARLLLENDTQAACTALQSVVEAPQRGPWTGPARLLFAECSLRLGDLDRADSLWADLEKRGGSAAYAARYHRAELLYFRGDFAAATAALAALATADLSHDLANDVLALLAVCEEYATSDALADLSRAQLLERQGQSEAADAHWSTLEEGADLGLAEWSLLIRAELRARQNRLDEARTLYQRQIARFPQGEHIVAAHLGLAELYERQGAIEQALKTCETALLQHPHDARAPEARLHIERLRHLRESG